MLRNEFDKIVTTTKRNHIFLGATDSKKIKHTLGEIKNDLHNIFEEIDGIKSDINIIASGMADPSDSSDKTTYLRRKIYYYEDYSKKWQEIQAAYLI